MLESKREIMSNNYQDKDSALTIELISLLNSKDVTPEKITEIKNISANIQNNDIKKVLLVDKLYGDNYLSKIVAIEALVPSLISDDQVRSILISLLQDNSHDSVKKAIIKTLVPFINKYKEIESAIVKILTNKYESFAVKEQVINVLASRLFKSDIRKLVMTKLDDENVNVKISAINALSNYLDDIEIFESILKKITDQNKMVRSSVIKALSAISDREEVKSKFVDRLNDLEEHQSVKETVIEAFEVCIPTSADIQELFVDLFFNESNSAIRKLVKNVLLRKLDISLVQDLFVSKLVFEKSKEDQKSNIKSKLSRLGEEPDDKSISALLNNKKGAKASDYLYDM